jgi:hypothetical protein
MKKLIPLLIVIGLLIYGCGPKEVKIVSIDTLVSDVDSYEGELIETSGLVAHVCGVEKLKLKLKSDNGNIIKVVLKDSTVSFDKNLYKKKLKVVGIVSETRIKKNYVDQVEEDKSLLCHIDNTLCKDSAWVQKKVEYGVADSLSAIDVKRLRDRMKDTGKDYVSVVTITADTIVVNSEQ